MALAREKPRLHVNALEPGIMFNTGLHANAGIIFQILAKVVVPVLAPFVKILSTPKRAARVATKILLDRSGQSGAYYDESGNPMSGSAQVRDADFAARVVTETRAFLSAIADEWPAARFGHE